MLYRDLTVKVSRDQVDRPDEDRSGDDTADRPQLPSLDEGFIVSVEEDVPVGEAGGAAKEREMVKSRAFGENGLAKGGLHRTKPSTMLRGR